MSPKETEDRKKGRLKRLTVFTAVLAAIVLMILRALYPFVPPMALATFAILLAILITTVCNFLYERRKKR
jgi:hypothetical protein